MVIKKTGERLAAALGPGARIPGAQQPEDAEDETPAYWRQVRAMLTRTLSALQAVALSPYDDLAAMARQALAEADALFSGEGDGDPGPREPGRYRATAEHLSGEVDRLRGLLVECGNEVDRLKAERDRLVEGARALERVAGSHERALYAAWIDVRHGDPGDADEILAEQLDGFDGPQWNGHESGIEWLERTREDAPAGGACSECKDGLVPIGCCNCGSPADASVNYAHERLCGFEPCPNGCWERLHPAVGAGTEGAGK